MLETFGILILFTIGWAILSWILRAGARTGAAAIKTATGGGTFSENLADQFYDMDQFEIRIVEPAREDDADGLQIKEVQVRGLFPVRQRTNVAFIISAFDVDDGDIQPVLSHFEEFQEPTTIAFQQRTYLGVVGPDQGLNKWITTGGIIGCESRMAMMPSA